jgi:hypothetical protein
MIYKLASRDNVDGERFDSWPAVLNTAFTKFNNTVEELTFRSEDDVLNWLESKCRTKISNRHTNVQEFRNGDPNKLYSVYVCGHANPQHGVELCDVFVYSLRIRKAHETYLTFVNEKGSRVKSSFKKIENGLDYSSSAEEIEYSSSPRIINKEYYEGVYPLDKNEKDNIHTRYLDFVKNVHELDTPENKAKDYDVVFVNSPHGRKWLEKFIRKLKHVERYLEFFAKGGNNQVNIDKDPDHDDMLDHIFKMLLDNPPATPEDRELHLDIRNMMIDPYLCTADIYQVRFNKTLMTWHKNYAYIIKKFGLVPSKTFSDMIMKFDLSDFYRQIHVRENLVSMIKNIDDIYGISANNVGQSIIFVKGKSAMNQEKPKFFKMAKSFITSSS